MANVLFNHKEIGIPLNEVGGKLRSLGESLEHHGMTLKTDTGVHINCSRDGETALSFVLEVYLYNEKTEEENNG